MRKEQWSAEAQAEWNRRRPEQIRSLSKGRTAGFARHRSDGSKRRSRGSRSSRKRKQGHPMTWSVRIEKETGKHSYGYRGGSPSVCIKLLLRCSRN